MDKKDLAMLIDAYADAKSTKNQYLIKTIGSQLEQVLDQLFPEIDGEQQ
jgi:hypothetical protein